MPINRILQRRGDSSLRSVDDVSTSSARGAAGRPQGHTRASASRLSRVCRALRRGGSVSDVVHRGSTPDTAGSYRDSAVSVVSLTLLLAVILFTALTELPLAWLAEAVR